MIARGLDISTAQFCNTSGATDAAKLDTLVRYLKRENLWSNARCYPMKSAQNAGSGSTIYGFGGLTAQHLGAVNSPVWSAAGMVFTATSSQSASLAANIPTTSYTASFLIRYKSTTATPGDGGPARLINSGFDGTNNRFYFGFGTHYTSTLLGCRYGDTTARNTTGSVSTGSFATLYADTSGLVQQNGTTILSITPSTGGGITGQATILGGEAGGYFDGTFESVLTMQAVPTATQRGALRTLMESL